MRGDVGGKGANRNDWVIAKAIMTPSRTPGALGTKYKGVEEVTRILSLEGDEP